MKYLHRFRVKAPLSKVAAFHQQADSLVALTPPPMRMEMQRVPVSFSKGGKVEFTLWFGLLPIHWVAIVEDVSETGFSDRQASGPFAEWVHRHSFLRVDDQTTEVIDQINLRLKVHPGWASIGLGFVLGLPVLFAYRGWKTRRLLEGGSG